ncbi:putative HTH-type transcriptional regulator YybE [Lactiplantibacillus plantarum subsp. plantarum]|uniref:Putative HTH-type transcriptional regulator YybE n=1 Tax=Lactiplantibacillus plantarum subsp. plantarum TaxID=337330 RepID=A0A2S3UAB9_LACPN|nr:putative HTH-type transcriptional regulator YybE [Lactiplantibacillus plantarum subsp. plantarum]
MNLNQLYYFRTLAEFQHYTKAAAHLYISQPSLSNAMKSLEKELGCVLFERLDETLTHRVWSNVLQHHMLNS